MATSTWTYPKKTTMTLADKSLVSNAPVDMSKMIDIASQPIPIPQHPQVHHKPKPAYPTNPVMSLPTDSEAPIQEAKLSNVATVPETQVEMVPHHSTLSLPPPRNSLGILPANCLSVVPSTPEIALDRSTSNAAAVRPMRVRHPPKKYTPESGQWNR